MIITPINWFCCIQLFFSFCLAAMETPDSSKMVKIKESDDAWPFAGKIIAYTTNQSYFGAYEGFVIDNNNELKYGYVEKEQINLLGQPPAFRIHQLKRYYETPNSSKSLMLQITRERNFAMAMRDAYDDEISFIAEAIKNRQAYFEDFRFIFSQEQQEVLKLLQDKLKNKIC